MEPKSEILEELIQWQSPLADIPRTMPFDVPGNYFGDLPGNVMAGLTEQTPLQWNDKAPFPVPEDYFNTLPEDILAKAKQADKTVITKSKRIPLFVFMRVAAAVLVIALGVAGYQYYNASGVTTRQQLAAVPDDDISQYLEQHLDEFDTEILVGNLSAADLSELENIGNDEIINYLNETGWETNENMN